MSSDNEIQLDPQNKPQLDYAAMIAKLSVVMLELNRRCESIEKRLELLESPQTKPNAYETPIWPQGPKVL